MNCQVETSAMKPLDLRWPLVKFQVEPKHWLKEPFIERTMVSWKRCMKSSHLIITEMSPGTWTFSIFIKHTPVPSSFPDYCPVQPLQLSEPLSRFLYDNNACECLAKVPDSWLSHTDLVGGDWNMTGLFSHSVGNVIIPIDELIFVRWVGIPPEIFEGFLCGLDMNHGKVTDIVVFSEVCCKRFSFSNGEFMEHDL